MEINNLLKNKILRYIDYGKRIEKEEMQEQKLFNNFYDISKYAYSFKNKIVRENITKYDVVAFFNHNIKKNNDICDIYLKGLNYDIKETNNNNETKTSTKDVESYEVLENKKIELNNINFMKKMINENKEIKICFWRNNNEFLHYDNNNLIKNNGSYPHMFIYDINGNREKIELKRVQESIKKFNNNDKFKLNCICNLSNIQNKDKKNINLCLLGGSEKGVGKIKFYSEQNEYIQDIKINNNNNDIIIPYINHMEVIENYNNKDNIPCINETEEKNKIMYNIKLLGINETSDKNYAIRQNELAKNIKQNYYLFVQYINKRVEIFELNIL